MLKTYNWAIRKYTFFNNNNYRRQLRKTMRDKRFNEYIEDENGVHQGGVESPIVVWSIWMGYL